MFIFSVILANSHVLFVQLTPKYIVSFSHEYHRFLHSFPAILCTQISSITRGSGDNNALNAQDIEILMQHEPWEDPLLSSSGVSSNDPTDADGDLLLSFELEVQSLDFTGLMCLIDDFPTNPLGKTGPLHNLYDEAEGISSIIEVISTAQSAFGATNIKQRAIEKASSPSVMGIDDAQVSSNSESFAQDPLKFLSSLRAHNADRRLSVVRILREFPEAQTFPEWERLVALSQGVRTPLDEDFVPSLYAASVRPAMRQIQPALNALAAISLAKGEAVVIRASDFRTTCTLNSLRAHLSCVHHIGKPDEDLGRFLHDYSNLPEGTPINSKQAKSQLPSSFGQLSMPSLAHLYKIVRDLQACFPDRQLYFHKSDVSRAFQRLMWSLEDSLLMAILLSEDQVLIPLAMGFGSSAAPYAYGVVTRFFSYMHQSRVKALKIFHPVRTTAVNELGIIFCDDAINCGTHELLVTEASAASRVVQTTLGIDAVNEAKDELNTCVTTLGVRSDLVSKLCSPSWRAYLKLVYVFFVVLPTHVDTTTVLPLKVMQCVAQLAHRYSLHIPWTRATASSFFMATKGNHPVRLSQRQVDDIYLWRWVLTAAVTDASILQTSFDSVIHTAKEFRSEAAQWADIMVYTDASGRETRNSLILPEALGVFIPGVAWLFWEWPGAPSHISNMELLAAILGFLLVLYMKPDSHHCHIYIDNTNAISWQMGKIKTDHYFSRNLVCLNALVQGVYSGCCQTRQYIPSKQNKVADAISRRSFDLPELRDIPAFRPHPNAVLCLIELSKPFESRPLQILLEKHIMSALNNSAAFFVPAI